MPEMTFLQLQQNVFDLFLKKEFSKVHELIDKESQKFPKKLEKILFWKVCVYAQQNEHEQAISLLKEAMSKGIWYNPQQLLQDEHLQPLQEKETFQLFIKQTEDLFINHSQESASKLFVYGNQKAPTALFTLHWRGSNVEDFSLFWLDHYTINEYFFAFLQSSQVYSSHAYCWDNKEIAKKEIEAAYSNFIKEHDEKQIILAGASQGGKLAIEKALTDKNVDSFLAIIPAINNLEEFETLLLHSSKNIKGCIITGTKDPFYNKTLELVHLLQQSGIKCKLFVKEGLGHFFPVEFTKDMKEGVAYLQADS